MSREWRERLTRAGLGIFCGKKSEEVILEEAGDIAQDKVNDSLKKTDLAMCEKSHIENARALNNVAMSRLLAGRATEALDFCKQVQFELEEALK